MIHDILTKFRGKRVLVLGDVMIDRYISGKVTRISPEAPVPILRHQTTEDRLGGAANVALNLLALGAIPILASVIGMGTESEAFLEALEKTNLSREGLIGSKNRKTTVKTRLIGNAQQMLRIDSEDTHDLDEMESLLLLQRLETLLENADALIIQDYNKGVLTENIIESAIRMGLEKGIPITVDPKKRNFFAYKGVTLFKPNLKEVRESLPFPVEATTEGLDKAANYLRSRLGQVSTMITLSEMGLFLENRGSGRIFPTKARKVADVSGAGDTVISVATLGLVAGVAGEELAKLCNLAGGQVCEFPGVVPVDLGLLGEDWTMTSDEVESL